MSHEVENGVAHRVVARAQWMQLLQSWIEKELVCRVSVLYLSMAQQGGGGTFPLVFIFRVHRAVEKTTD